jgi:hypothetical protein
MKKLILLGFTLLSLSACEKSSDRTQRSSTSYQPTEFIRSFDAKNFSDADWRSGSRSEEFRLYGSSEGSFRKGKITLGTNSPNPSLFPASSIKAVFRSAPGFRESGELVFGEEYRCVYGDAVRYTGSITARVLQSSNGIEVEYEIVERPKSEPQR